MVLNMGLGPADGAVVKLARILWCDVGRLAGVIEAAPRFNGAREILVKAVINNLTALACVTIGRGHT